MKNTNWWKKAVIYQIYPKSFQDSNGDGIGDLQGIISRLDYLQKLGVDALWISPIYCSPQDDNGYDISDYRNIDPIFGNLSDMDELIAEGKKRGIGMIMDLVLNHSSDEHIWFREAKKSRENPYHNYYVWRDGTEDAPPNDLRAAFGGSAWQWVPEVQQYYFHQFSIKQPDLNWENPTLRQEIYQMINWWIDRGIAGFRLDVIDQIAKEPDQLITGNGPRLHEYLRELSRETFQRADLITVGEAWGADVERAKLYSNPDNSEFSMVFQFEHSLLDQQPGKEKWDLLPLNLVRLKKVFEKWQTGLFGCGWNSLFWDNHDLPRIVSRWGNDSRQYREVSAKMLATVLHGMQGTPYIYQGEELGMTNIHFPLEELRDLETVNMYQKRVSEGYDPEEVMNSIYAKARDNARSPFQWNDSKYAGFTDGTPWMNVNPNYTEIHAKAQMEDPDSVFHYYQKLISLRKRYDVFTEGTFTLFEAEHPDLFVYGRSWEKQELLVIANFHGAIVHFEMPEAFAGRKAEHILIHNYPDMREGVLRPYEAMILLFTI